MSLHLHCPYCGELLAEDQSVVVQSVREGTRQETFDLACRCGTRVRLQLPPERWRPSRRRRRSARGHSRRGAAQRAPATAPVVAEVEPLRPTAERPFPFTAWQYARLLLLRGRVQDGEMVEGGEPAGGEASA